MAKWKPTFYRVNGKPGATAPMRRLAHKMLENMKHRNEVLGNYANPVYRFQFDGNKFMFSSLPGYDIIDITVPSVEGEYDPTKDAEIYSGCWEPRFQSGGFGWHMRWYPAAYEVFNSETDSGPPILGASVDGAAEDLDTPLPPVRWLYTDTNNPVRKETPWFEDSSQSVTNQFIKPGKYSGKLRELVQMQLGYGLLPNFFYTASHSNGIYLEVLDEDTTRIWLIEISGTNGIVKQIMGDFTVAGFEKAQNLDVGGIPPEIEQMGWFDTHTGFDTSRPVYTKSEWDAIPEDEQPSIKTITFQMLSASDYAATVEDYQAHGDYGWSFNPEGTSAVLVGLQWNYPEGGGLAVNYKAQMFTVTFNHPDATATLAGGGKQVFLMDNIFSQVKWPDIFGDLNTAYYFKGQNGNKGTQPSSAYTVPIYTYYDLTGNQVTCNYQYSAGNTDSQNYNLPWSGWEEVIACRKKTTWGTTVFTYHECSTAQSGVGSFAKISGFNTSIISPEAGDSFAGSRLTFSSTDALVTGIMFMESRKLKLYRYPTEGRAAGMHSDTQYADLASGNWYDKEESVLIVPSFERLGFYHYKKRTESLTEGTLSHPMAMTYEKGDLVRWHGDASIGQQGCELYAHCTPGFGQYGNREVSAETPGYYYAWNGLADTQWPIWIGCSVTTGNDCFVTDAGTVRRDLPADESPYTRTTITVEGGLKLPDGGTVMFSDDEINNQSSPFRESTVEFGKQSVISCFDTFSSKYIYSMPEIALTPRKHTADGFPDDFVRRGVLFSGMPYFI